MFKKIILYFLLTIISTTFLTSETYTVTAIRGSVKASVKGKSSKLEVGSKISGDTLIKVFQEGNITVKNEKGVTKTASVGTHMLGALFEPAKKNDLLYSKVVKLGNDATRSITTPAVVAGVRGAEQGKKGQFGVTWGGNKDAPSQEINNIKNIMKASHFEPAIARLSALQSKTTESALTAEIHYLTAVCHYELIDFQNAKISIDNAILKAPNESLKQKYSYTLQQVLFMQNDFINCNLVAESVTDKTLDTFWPGRLLKLYSLISLGQRDLAVIEKEKILLESNDPEIKNTASETLF